MIRGKFGIFQILFVSLLLLQSASTLDCPANCICSWVLDSLEINCARSGLVEYPALSDTRIEHIDLSSNNFNEFPKQYGEIDSLIYLDLSNNHIEYIDADALRGFEALRTLILANNTIASWASLSPNEAFRNAISLKRLSLSGNRLESFKSDNPNLMLRSDSLTHLELERCDITTAGGDQLMNGLPNLEFLKLSNNAITSLTAMPSKTLRVLEMSGCKLSYFGSFMLYGLPNLEALNLSWNMGLQFGAKDDLVFSQTLTHLDVSYCNLDSIDLSALPILSTILLRSNMLREIATKTFANNTLLEVIDLSRNSLRIIANEAFIHLKRLTKLDMSYNEIARLDRTIFRANDALVSLDMSRNVFERFPKLVSKSLRSINLSWCEILGFDSSAISSLTALQRLDLSNNLLKEFPGGLHSATLQELNLSNCKLTALQNNSLSEFPELSALRLNGNRFTNPLPVRLFRENKYLHQLWLGDNPWICNCHDHEFIEFYDYVTSKPAKLKDKFNVRCTSPTLHYGLTWESACRSVWLPSANRSTGDKVFTVILFLVLGAGVLFLLFALIKRYIKKRKQIRDRREYRRNHEEMRQIRLENQRILEQDAAPNAPSLYETNLPSYEDALLMPKLERPVKSMVDLTASARARKKLQRSRTDPEEQVDYDPDLLVDCHHRFRSEEMLSNRDKERTAQIVPYRRTGNIEHNNSGTRRFSIEDSRFVAAHFKSQNLQSAEQIANFQSYENSPYTKRKAKIAEIPPFKRATLIADSVEFLTDPEFEAELAKPASPFAQRKPKTPTTPTIGPSAIVLPESRPNESFYVNLAPAIEDHFDRQKNCSGSSSTGSNFDMVVRPELASLSENIGGASTSDDVGTEQARKRKKRKNSSRRASGNFTNAAASAANGSSSSDNEAIVVVHKPLRETIF